MHSQIACEYCGKGFAKTRTWARFCSSACRARAHRNGRKTSGGVEVASVSELTIPSPCNFPDVGRIQDGSDTPRLPEPLQQDDGAPPAVRPQTPPRGSPIEPAVENELERTWPEAERWGWAY